MKEVDSYDCRDVAFRNTSLRTGLRKSLSKRELEVAKLVCEGLGRKEIASKLGITYNTLCRHLENVYYKIGIHTELQLLKYMLKQGHLTINDL